VAITPVIAATVRCWWRFDAEQEKELAEVHRAQTVQGFAIHALTAAEVHARRLGLSPQVRSGLFIPSDHWSITNA